MNPERLRIITEDIMNLSCVKEMDDIDRAILELNLRRFGM